MAITAYFVAGTASGSDHSDSGEFYFAMRGGFGPEGREYRAGAADSGGGCGGRTRSVAVAALLFAAWIC